MRLLKEAQLKLMILTEKYDNGNKRKLDTNFRCLMKMSLKRLVWLTSPCVKPRPEEYRVTKKKRGAVEFL